MSQSNAIFAFIFLAYLAYITLKGELPSYAGFLLLAPAGGGNGAASGGTGTADAGIGGSGVTSNDVANVAKVAVMFL